MNRIFTDANVVDTIRLQANCGILVFLFSAFYFTSNNSTFCSLCFRTSINGVLYRDSLGNSDLSHVTSVGEVVIARAHVAVLPRLRDTETRRVARCWGVVQLILQVVNITAVASSVQVKIQLVWAESISLVNHFKRQAGASCWFERAASFFYPTHVCPVRPFEITKEMFNCV